MIDIITDNAEILRSLEKLSYQGPLSRTLKCAKCECEALIMMIIDDEDGEISQQRPDNVRIWPHDAMVIALYMCPECGEITVDWNQA